MKTLSGVKTWKLKCEIKVQYRKARYEKKQEGKDELLKFLRSPHVSQS